MVYGGDWEAFVVYGDDSADSDVVYGGDTTTFAVHGVVSADPDTGYAYGSDSAVGVVFGEDGRAG